MTKKSNTGRLTLKNVQVTRQVCDLRRDEVEVLAMLPYSQPGRFGDPCNKKIARRMLRGGFLESCPTSLRSDPVLRCTDKGAKAVLWFKRRGWLPDLKLQARSIGPKGATNG